MQHIDINKKYSISHQKMLLMLLLYSGLYIVGASMQFSQNISLHSLGAGLILPAGGFFYQASIFNTWWLLLIGVMALCHFIYTLFCWFATGNALAPVLSWFTSGVVASLLCHSQLNSVCLSKDPSIWIFSGVLILPLAWLALRFKTYWAVKNSQKIQKIPLKNLPEPQIGLNQDDLPHLRFLLDRALQPIENFDGFEWIDQYQTSAVRYQLNFFGYALALCQAQHLPAMRAYFTQAQEKLLLKLQDYRIWQYWQYESKWGKLKRQHSPASLDNIMFTGFAATQISLFHQANQSQHFLNTPLVFNHPQGINDSANLAKLVNLLQISMKKSDYFLAACEPNWVYPLCNIISAIAIKMQQPAWWHLHQAQFLHILQQEFTRPNGSFISCRSHLTGWALPNIGGVLPQALTCFFLNAIAPQLAEQHWLLLREQLVNQHALNRRQFWPIDTGNYGYSRAAAYAGTALAAREFGDSEVATLCLNQLDAEYPCTLIEGVAHRANVSVWAHALACLARMHQTKGLYILVHKESQELHPVIDKVPYPYIQILLARYQHEQLEIRLSAEQSGTYNIKLAQLKPNTCYQYHGESSGSFISDTEGKASLALLVSESTSYYISLGQL